MNDKDKNSHEEKVSERERAGEMFDNIIQTIQDGNTREEVNKVVEAEFVALDELASESSDEGEQA